MNKYIDNDFLYGYMLIKDLPGLKKGAIFKPCKVPDKNGKPSYYFSSLTDDEFLSGNFQDYKIYPEFVEQNEEWFVKVTGNQTKKDIEEYKITKNDIQESLKISNECDYVISLSGYEPTPLTFREEEILHMVGETPNDFELDKIIREYVNKTFKK